MLLNLREYHRPASADGPRQPLDLALDLLARTDSHTAILAGGSQLLACDDVVTTAVVDLQALGLDQVRKTTDGLAIGSMVTRARLADDAMIRDVCSGIVAQGAHGWGGSIQRNRATLGGAVAVAAGNDPLVVALLACDASVVLCQARGDDGQVLLADFLHGRQEALATPALIVDVVIPTAASAWTGAMTAVARTPSDAPIVLACAALAIKDGRCTHARLAVGGVAEQPLRLMGVEEMLEGWELTDALLAQAAASAKDAVAPAGDFRGSAEYRRAMVEVLAARALAQARDRAR
jgi:carbon-monoxide dehydrogenase medium subunit